MSVRQLLSTLHASVFNERLEPGQSVIPLLGNEIEIFLNSRNRLRVEFEPAFAAYPDAVYDPGPLQNAKMLGNRLPR